MSDKHEQQILNVLYRFKEASQRHDTVNVDKANELLNRMAAMINSKYAKQFEEMKKEFFTVKDVNEGFTYALTKDKKKEIKEEVKKTFTPIEEKTETTETVKIEEEKKSSVEASFLDTLKEAWDFTREFVSNLTSNMFDFFTESTIELEEISDEIEAL